MPLPILHLAGGELVANKLIPVRFKVGMRGYNAGEIAGFDEETARKLVESGKAEWVEGFEPGPPPEPEYEKLSATELRKLAEARGINVAGRTKKEVIALLKGEADNDAKPDGQDGAAGNDEGADDSGSGGEGEGTSPQAEG